MNNIINDEIADSFQKDLEQFHIKLNYEQTEQFFEYYSILIEWNSFMNLTAITDIREVFKKHFVDSVSLIKAVPDLANLNAKIIDVGTGAGFPGIPLKIIYPNLHITLLDSLNKRVNFLNEVINRLGLDNIEAVHGRAEDLAKPGVYREQFDYCISRAVANLSTLSEYCIPFVKRDGYFISYKSEKINEEQESAKAAIKILGGCIEEQVDFNLPNSEIYRNLFVIKKEINTPKNYPRKAGLPAKEPLK